MDRLIRQEWGLTLFFPPIYFPRAETERTRRREYAHFDKLSAGCTGVGIICGYDATMLRLTILLLIVVHMGCGSVGSRGTASHRDCPKDNDVTGIPLGSGATYSVERLAPGKIIIRARGRNGQPGWTNLLACGESRTSQSPNFSFHQRPPSGMAAQVMTDFDLCLKYEVDAVIDRVIIRDAAGNHQFEIEDVASPRK